MKAIIWTKYGPADVLQIKEVEKPIPKDGEVLVKVFATTVTAGDCELRGLKGPLLFTLALRLYAGFSKPARITILGQELAGQIEAVGTNVTRFIPGDQVFAWTGLRLGAYAEYICLPENGMVAIKPSNLTYADAAVLPVGGLEAAHFVSKSHVRNGEKVLINGAGGSIGTFAVQLARHYGASVTAVDSTGKLDMLRSIGADQVIDYTREDFTKKGETYDVIYDVIGKSSFSRSISSLKPNGRYIIGNLGMFTRLRAGLASQADGKQVILWEQPRFAEDVSLLRRLVETGQVRSIIDKRYPMDQIAEAHRYVESGQKKGNVVIVIAEEPA